MPKRCPTCGSLVKPSLGCCGTAKLQKKKSRWDETKPKIKPWFLRAGILHCELQLEGCNESTGTGFAHAKNQRHLSDRELYIVALLCHHCHQKIEGKAWMQQTILDIRKRNTIPEIDEVINEVYGK
jgi:hypothetical protein